MRAARSEPAPMFAAGRWTGCQGSDRGRNRKWEIPTVGQVFNLSLRGAETGILEPKQVRPGFGTLRPTRHPPRRSTSILIRADHFASIDRAKLDPGHGV